MAESTKVAPNRMQKGWKAMGTRLLEQAFAEVSKLPEEEQELLAAWILEEVASERLWDKAFMDSADALARLADEATDEHLEGRTQVLDPDRLACRL